MTSQSLKRTTLTVLHLEHGAKLVPFAGYEMPLHYSQGIFAEHKHTRDSASLFDVSHMGQAWLAAVLDDDQEPSHETIAALLETLVPGDITSLMPGRMRYSLLLNGAGGILDDFMILRPDEPNQGRLFMVANAATKDADFAHIETLLGSALRVMPLLDHALLALQGPKAASVLERCIKGTSNLAFMQAREFDVDGQTSLISRSGYTGEDGFEISVPSDHAESLARQLLNQDEVAFAGLGARDSLRLEAGLCLYGHDLTEDINPVEADLRWMIGKHRREEGGFPGARHILELLQHGSDRIRIGIVPEGRAPAREGALIQDQQGRDIGLVTSGTFGPTYGGPIAMGYVDRAFSEVGTELQLVIRGTPCPACVTSLPFVPHRYHRKG
jgi:aminomethyltransferase